MKTKRIADFDRWSPQPMGSFSKGDVIPTPDEAIFTEVIGVKGKTVELECEVRGKTRRYDFDAPTEEDATKVVAVLGKNPGKNLLELGELRIEV